MKYQRVARAPMLSEISDLQMKQPGHLNPSCQKLPDADVTPRHRTPFEPHSTTGRGYPLKFRPVIQLLDVVQRPRISPSLMRPFDH